MSFVPQIHLGKFLISVPDCKMKQLPGCVAVSRVKTKVIRNERVEFCRGGIIHPEIHLPDSMLENKKKLYITRLVSVSYTWIETD